MDSLPDLSLSTATYDTATEVRVDDVLSPISRLPPELLATIFVHCACDYYEHHESNSPPFPSWVNVSYVCRHWRDVALDCPTLWTYHFAVSLRWTEELLARSRQASLKIGLLTSYLDNQSSMCMRLGLVDVWMKHIERIQELILYLPAEKLHEVVSKLSLRASCLQTLKISTWGYHDPPDRILILFDGHTPVLRTLELSDCPVALSSLRLRGLTTLVLRHLPVRFRQHPEELLAMLSCMQDLEHLDLDEALAGATTFLADVTVNTFQKINLPHLSYCSITAPLSTVIVFLSLVDILLEAEVRLQCALEDDSPLDDIALFSLLLAHRFDAAKDRALSSLTIRSLLIEFVWDMTRLVFGTSGHGRISFKFWNCDFPLKVIIDSTSSMIARDLDHIVSNICCSIPLRNVQRIEVIRPPPQLDFWREMLGNLPDLRYIKLSYGNMPDLASVLSYTAFEGEENLGRHSCTLVPVLEVLELHQIFFSLEGTASQVAISQRHLFDALSTRDAAKLGRLIMTQCRILHSGWLPDTVRSWDGADIRVIGESGSDLSESNSYEE